MRAALGVEEAELTGDDWFRCQQMTDDARAAGLDGLLAPSGALPGETTLIVFPDALVKVTAEHPRVQRPPIRMLDTSPTDSPIRMETSAKASGRRL